MSVINTNYRSLVEQNNLHKSSSALGTAIERISSGIRIKSASDDKESYAILDRQKVQVQNVAATNRHFQSTQTVLQIAGRGLSETNNILMRMKDLATQANSGSHTESDRSGIQGEMDKLSKEITNIAENSNYNGHRILDGSLELQTQTKSFGGQDSSIKIEDMRSEALGLSNLSFASSADVTDSLSKIDKAMAAVSDQHSAIGEEMSALQKTYDDTRSSTENTLNLSSRITSQSEAIEMSNRTKELIMEALKKNNQNILKQHELTPAITLSLLR